MKAQTVVLIAGLVIVALVVAAKAAQTNYLGTIFIADSSTPTQQLAVNSDGSINAKVVSGSATLSSLTIAGNLSVAGPTTGGVRLIFTANTINDTTGSGTVANVYGNHFSGDTFTATGTVTYTNLYDTFFDQPIAGSGVTATNRFALGAANANIGGLTISTNGTLTPPTGSSIIMANANGAELLAGAASSTVPTVVVNRADTTTGWGAQASGNMSAVIGGAEKWRFTSTGPQAVTLPTDAAESAVCTTTGAGGTLSTAAAAACSGVSSRVFKHAIVPIGSILERVMQVQPDMFRFNRGTEDGGKSEQYGLIAEDVAKAFPAGKFPDLVVMDAKGKPHAINWQGFDTAILTKALQEEQAEIIALKAANDDLTARLARLERHRSKAR